MDKMAQALGIPPLAETLEEEGGDLVPVDDNLPAETEESALSERELKRQREIEDDYELARDSIHHALEKVKKALDDAVEVSVQSQEPRAYEVAAGLVKTMSDSAKDILDIHQKKDALDSMAPTGGKPEDDDPEKPKLILTADLSSMFSDMARQALQDRERDVVETVEEEKKFDSDDAVDGEFVPPSFGSTG